MTNALTDWRLVLTAALEANTFQDGLFKGKVLAKERDGASAEPVACVFIPPFATDGNPLFLRPTLTIRVWLVKPKLRRDVQPPDPAPLEELLADLQALLEPLQALPDVGPFGLFMQSAQFEIDYDDWGVQATVSGWAGNPASLAIP